MAHGVPDVVCSHGDEEHPRQRAPGVFETSKPHEEAEGEADDGDDGGAVQRGPLGKRDGSLEGQTNMVTARAQCITADQCTSV